ncbi:MAG: hypothetical protein WD830_02165 [Chloroflexota bacterium]
MSRSFRPSLALVLAAAFLASGTLVACTSDPGWPPEQMNFALIPAPVNAQVVVGENRMLFNVLDRQNQSIASADRPLLLQFFHLATSRTQILEEAEATFIPTVQGRPGLYRAIVAFDRAGEWGVQATSTESDDTKRTGRFVFPVRELGTTPALGAQAIASETPTADTAEEIAAISTDDDPEPDFYRQSVPGALAAHEPFALIFATPAFCRSATCGPTLDVVKSAAAPFMDRMTFIHVEPYELEMVGGHLRPVLSPDNDPIPTAATTAWGLPTEPYIFVVDAQGKVTAKFEGIASADELSAAFEAVATP